LDTVLCILGNQRIADLDLLRGHAVIVFDIVDPGAVILIPRIFGISDHDVLVGGSAVGVIFQVKPVIAIAQNTNTADQAKLRTRSSLDNILELDTIGFAFADMPLMMVISCMESRVDTSELSLARWQLIDPERTWRLQQA
jgi:hypothetical protein